MSNHKSGENPDRRKPKVSLAMFVNQGLGGPNPVPDMVQEMDGRLIFRPLNTFRWSDESLYFRRVIGFSLLF